MKKVMLHIIMPRQVSGPNSAARRISESYLNQEYEFGFVTQEYHAGGKVNFRLIQELRRQILEFRPELVHLSGLQASGFHAVVAARLAGCKNILITIRGFSGDVIGLSIFKRFAFNCIFEPLTLRLCTKFYTVCEEATKKKMVQKYSKKYLGVIHNAAPYVDYATLHAGDFRNELGINWDAFLVAVVGRMVYDKGISYIADAIDKISDKNIKFIFIGDGEYCDILKKRFSFGDSKDQVFILGQRNDVLNILNDCDLFLFATLHENLSNALLEAMTIGLPVVATAVGGNVEVVEDNENGFLIQPEDSHAIAKKIEIISINKEMQKKFSRRSKEIIEKDFTQSVVYQKISAIYNTMIEKSTKGKP